MRNRLFFLVLLATSVVGLNAHEIAIIGGEPDGTLEFVQKMAIEKTEITHGEHEQYGSTMTYSILNDYGIRDTALMMVVDKDASTDSSSFIQGINLAQSKAPVVYTDIGPVSDEICQIFSKYLNTVFVIGAGNNSEQIDASSISSCSAGNILMVAYLNQTRGKLLSSSNWGFPVKVASPSFKIRVTVPGGSQERWTLPTMGKSIAAAQLALFAREHPELRGASLVEQFLHSNAAPLFGLQDRVSGGLALRIQLAGIGSL